MDDRLYQEALRRREQLRAEIEVLQRKLKDVESLIQLAERVFSGRDQDTHGGLQRSTSESVESELAESTQARRRNPEPPSKLAEIARDEILAHGRPMTRGELVGALERRGVELVAKDKAKNLGTILWRFRNQFENIPGKGYWPKDRAPPGKLV